MARDESYRCISIKCRDGAVAIENLIEKDQIYNCVEFDPMRIQISGRGSLH